MCGIAAIFGKNLSLKKLFKRAHSMCQAVNHRGPDDMGVTLFPTNPSHQPILFSKQNLNTQQLEETEIPCIAAMGHTRLSILDLSSHGHQPMSSRDGRYWIVYNGEVYNYKELGEELNNEGCEFSSATDTEVVLYAFIKWGKSCLNRFNGMFAFVIYDCIEQKLFAARDRFGVKPLYYWISPSQNLHFGSEIKQFTVLEDWSSKIHHQAAYDYLNWGVTDHLHETLFKGVFQIKGGESIEHDLHDPMPAELKPKRWYILSPQPFSGTYEEAKERFRELFLDSIRLRLRTDVPIGSCLSGGIDSSSIVCALNHILGEQKGAEKQKTFSSCSHNALFSEKEFVDEVVQSIDVNPTYCSPTFEGLFEALPDLIWKHDEPFSSVSMYAQWQVFKSVNEHGVKVILNGQGSDEQLAGYTKFFGYHFSELFRKARFIDLYRELKNTYKLHPKQPSFSMMVNQLLPNSVRNPILKFLGRPCMAPDWIDFDRLNAVDQYPFNHLEGRSVNDYCRHELLAVTLPMLLRYDDRNSMAHSVESRTPFLDYRLVEFIAGLPSHYKISNGWTKRILRESMEPYVPSKITKRLDKKGFVTEEEHWTVSEHPEFIREQLKKAIEQSDGIINSKGLKTLDDILEGKKPFTHTYWRIICFGNWMKKFSMK